MKGYIRDLLQRIEKETPITFGYSFLRPTERTYNYAGDPIDLDTILIDEKMALSISSCGYRTCQNILCMHIFYGHSSELKDAEAAKKYIKKVAPKIRIELVDELCILTNYK